MQAGPKSGAPSDEDSTSGSDRAPKTSVSSEGSADGPEPVASAAGPSDESRNNGQVKGSEGATVPLSSPADEDEFHGNADVTAAAQTSQRSHCTAVHTRFAMVACVTYAALYL